MARPKQPILSKPIIFEAALRLTDRKGLFTIPDLARELNVSVSSLYHHVGGREDIVEGVRGLVMAAVVPLPDVDWRTAVRLWAMRKRDAYAAHPAAVPMLIMQSVTDQTTLDYYEQLGEILANQAGLKGEALLTAIAMIDSLWLGSALDLASPANVWDSVDRASAFGEAVSTVNASERAQKAFEVQLDLLIDALPRLDEMLSRVAAARVLTAR